MAFCYKTSSEGFIHIFAPNGAYHPGRDCWYFGLGTRRIPLQMRLNNMMGNWGVPHMLCQWPHVPHSFEKYIPHIVYSAVLWRPPISLSARCVWLVIFHQTPVSLMLMASQFKGIVTHMYKLTTVKCVFCAVWVQNFVWNFKVTFEISHNILNPYTAKYVFDEVLNIWRLMIS